MSTLNHQPLTALVTGATAGLCKEIALRLARDDLQIVIFGRDAARGAAVVEHILAAGGQARFIATDLSDPADIKHLAEQVGNVRAPYMLVGAVAPAMAERGTGS